MLIRAHFDGQRIVPDEPLSLPVNVPLRVTISVDPEQPAEFDDPGNASPELIAKRKEALRSLIGWTHVGKLPENTSRSDNFYDERE